MIMMPPHCPTSSTLSSFPVRSQDDLNRGDAILTDDLFQRFSAQAFQRTGIVLDHDKKTLVLARLSKRLKALDLKSFEDYESFLTGPNGSQEITPFINAITTNLTRFFREKHHFDHVKNKIIPDLIQRYESSPSPENKRVRFWSAGCSSGEEAYSLAMVCAAHFPTYFDVKILATDIDTNMVKKGQDGIYKDIQDIPKEYQSYCEPDFKNTSDFSISPAARKLVTFKHLNLLESWPIHGPFQAVFCRNVVIYFNKDTQKILFQRIADLLEPKGWLYIGHSESLFKVSDLFSTSGQTIYQKESYS